MIESDIADVSALHIRALPTVSARIGAEYLTRLYRTLLDHPELHTSLVAREGARCIGAITYTRNLRRTTTLLPLTAQTIRMIMSALIRSRITLGELWETWYREFRLNRQGIDPYQTILTLFVDPSKKRRGIGKKLFSALLPHVPKHVSLYVDTERVNTSAQKFYTSVGFTNYRSFGTTMIYRR